MTDIDAEMDQDLVHHIITSARNGPLHLSLWSDLIRGVFRPAVNMHTARMQHTARPAGNFF